MPSCQDPNCHCNLPVHEPFVPCMYCDEPTPMTGTKLCHHCYEVSARLPRFIAHPKGLAFVLSCLPQPPEDKYDPKYGDDIQCANCYHPYVQHFEPVRSQCYDQPCHRFAVGN